MPEGTRPIPAAEYADLLHRARTGGRLLDGATEVTGLSITAAYAVQEQLTARRLAEGRRPIGYKLGYTSAAMREQMNVAEPNFGPLLDDMVVPDGGVAEGFLHPRVEPEIGVVLGADLQGAELTVPQVAAAVREVRACLEIVDSIWRGYRFTLEQNTADGSSAAGVVVGPPIDVDPAHCEEVTVEFLEGPEAGAVLLASATGAAASGHPLAGVAWLCAQLAASGRGLRAGDLVITGGLSAAVELRPGSTLRAIFNGRTQVSVSRA